MKTYSVAWIPDNKPTPITTMEVKQIGGRIIDENINKLDAEKVERCLKINGELLPGDYITVLDTKENHNE